MNKYTVVGLLPDGLRIAAWVEADDPEGAIEVAQNGGGIDGDVPAYGDALEVAGVFAGHIAALDEQ